MDKEEGVADTQPDGSPAPVANLYVEREADAEFRRALASHDGVILVQGSRHVGKSSLVARGLVDNREAGDAVVTTDCAALTSADMESADVLLARFAQAFADTLNVETQPADVWRAARSASVNFERYLRRNVLSGLSSRLIWVIDGVDDLFRRSYANEVFGLFRSLHNKRSLDPSGPWGQFSLVITYATEAHLFITDVNQSPFNVGTHIPLADFTHIEIAELNRSHGSPLESDAEVTDYFRLLNGHPHLSQVGLVGLRAGDMDMDALMSEAAHEDGPYADHLAEVSEMLEEVSLRLEVGRALRGEPCASAATFYELRAKGILTGDAPEDASIRCPLYRAYLEGRSA
jgi:hypothetical protein